MNFNHIILKNFRQNRGIMRCIYCHLLLVLSYILALSQLGMCAILILINLSMSSVKEHNLAVIFLFVIILIFIIYSNMLFVKRRFREFALYQVIGLSKRNLVHIVMVEQIAIW